MENVFFKTFTQGSNPCNKESHQAIFYKIAIKVLLKEYALYPSFLLCIYITIPGGLLLLFHKRSWAYPENALRHKGCSQSFQAIFSFPHCQSLYQL